MFASIEEAESWIMGEIKKAFPTVHILKSGFPMCGFSLAAAGQWPVGHTWVSFLGPDPRSSATCEDCKREHAAHGPS